MSRDLSSAMPAMSTAAMVEVEPLRNAYAASARTHSSLSYLCAVALVAGFITGIGTGLNLPRSSGRAVLPSQTYGRNTAPPPDAWATGLKVVRFGELATPDLPSAGQGGGIGAYPYWGQTLHNPADSTLLPSVVSRLER